MRLIALLRNVRLTWATVRQHVGDDPVLLLQQTSRRLPVPAARLFAQALCRTGRDTSFGRPLGAYLLGENRRAAQLLEAALTARPSVRQAGRLAEVALAGGEPDLADRFLAAAVSCSVEVPDPAATSGTATSGTATSGTATSGTATSGTATSGTARSGTRSHPAATSGTASGTRPAATQLAGTIARRRWYDGDMSGAVVVLRSAGRHRQADRLESELRVFQGWTPSLQPVPGYEPAPATVLHALTNSLPYTPSGYAQRSHSILQAQQQLGWSVHAATRLGYPVQVGKLFAADTDVLDGVTYHRLLPPRLATGFDARLQQQADELLCLALEVKPAVLHTTTHFVNGLVVRAVAQALGIPWVYEVRGQLVDTWAAARPDAARTSERYKLFSECEAQVMHSASLVVTLGKAMKQDIVRKGVPQGRVLLCPNAVGEQYLGEPLDPPAARSLLGLPESLPGQSVPGHTLPGQSVPGQTQFIGTVSSLVDYEGLDDLLRAFALLAPSRSGLYCLIVGDGAAAPSLRALARDLGISARTIFTGRVPREKAHLYHQALDLFVVPRRDLDVTRAVTPLKPVEALASARPVVASDLPALLELVEPGATGLLAAPENPQDLAAAIELLLGDETLRRSLGREGRRRVLAERTWTAGARHVVENYARLGGVA